MTNREELDALLAAEDRSLDAHGCALHTDPRGIMVSQEELAIRRETEGNPEATELCSGCNYGFWPHETGACPKCHSGGREEATAFCEVPLSARMEAATAQGKIDKARKSLLTKAAKAAKADHKQPYAPAPLGPAAKAKYAKARHKRAKARAEFAQYQAKRALK